MSTACHQSIKRICPKCELVRETFGESKMRTNKFACVTSLQFRLMGKALEFGEINESGEYYTRGGVAEELGGLIYPCYMLGLNPLQHLRRVFPSFVWCFHDFYLERGTKTNPHLDRATKQMVANADIFWQVNDFDTHCFITARLNSQKQPPMMFYGNKSFKKLSEDPSSINAVEWVRSIGGQDIGE